MPTKVKNIHITMVDATVISNLCFAWMTPRIITIVWIAILNDYVVSNRRNRVHELCAEKIAAPFMKEMIPLAGMSRATFLVAHDGIVWAAFDIRLLSLW